MSCEGFPNCEGSSGSMSQAVQPLLLPDLPIEEDRHPKRALKIIKKQLEEEFGKLDQISNGSATLSYDKDNNITQSTPSLGLSINSIDKDRKNQVQLFSFKTIRWRVGETPTTVASNVLGSPKKKNEQILSLIQDCNDSTGPWEASFYITPTNNSDTVTKSTTSFSKSSPFLNQIHTVDIRFNSSYPYYPPQVSIRSTLHHPFLQAGGDSGAMPMLFYQAYLKMREGKCPGDSDDSSGTQTVTNQNDSMDSTDDTDGYFTLSDILQAVIDFLALTPSDKSKTSSIESLQKLSDRGQLTSRDKCTLQALMLFESYPEHYQYRMNIENYQRFRKCPKFFEIRSGDQIPDEWLDPRFRAWRDQCGYKDKRSNVELTMPESGNGSDAKSFILTQHADGADIYSFPLFTYEFCDMLVNEVRSIYDSGIEVQRPNSMNRYGVILNYIGLEGLMTAIQKLLEDTGLAEEKFSHTGSYKVKNKSNVTVSDSTTSVSTGGIGSTWDGHHSFIVQYAPNKDLGLDMHTDDSDVTSNICLGIDFSGSQVAFCGKMGASDHRKELYIYEQQKGHCLLHLGKQRHGAVSIKSGERMNLIIWSRSSRYRRTKESKSRLFHVEESKPDEVCLSYTHDRDYGVFKDYPKGFEKFRGRGWCPPPGAEYAGFKEE